MKTIFAVLLSFYSCEAQVTIRSPIPAEVTTDRFHVKLTNPSDVCIVAMVTIWTVIEQNGAPVGSMKINHDFYAGDCQIEAHGSVVVSYSIAGMNADLRKPTTIEVDSVLFADGTFIGRNKFGLDSYIEAKWRARDQIARDLLAYKGKEDQIKERLERYEKEVPEGLPYPVSNWQFYNHRAGIMRGWVAFYSGMLGEDKSAFWREIEEIAKGKE